MSRCGKHRRSITGKIPLVTKKCRLSQNIYRSSLIVAIWKKLCYNLKKEVETDLQIKKDHRKQPVQGGILYDKGC